jgi:hypothetical protein
MATRYNIGLHRRSMVRHIDPSNDWNIAPSSPIYVAALPQYDIKSIIVEWSRSPGVA